VSELRGLRDDSRASAAKAAIILRELRHEWNSCPSRLFRKSSRCPEIPRLKALLVVCGSTARLEAAPFQNGI